MGVEWGVPGQASGDKEDASTPGSHAAEPASPDSKRSRGCDWWPGPLAPPLPSHLPGGGEGGMELGRHLTHPKSLAPGGGLAGRSITSPSARLTPRRLL